MSRKVIICVISIVLLLATGCDRLGIDMGSGADNVEKPVAVEPIDVGVEQNADGSLPVAVGDSANVGDVPDLLNTPVADEAEVVQVVPTIEVEAYPVDEEVAEEAIEEDVEEEAEPVAEEQKPITAVESEAEEEPVPAEAEAEQLDDTDALEEESAEATEETDDAAEEQSEALITDDTGAALEPLEPATEAEAPVTESDLGDGFHVIQPGQALSEIATLYGLRFDVLAAHNQIADPNAIQAGLVLTIPTAGEAAQIAQNLDAGTSTVETFVPQATTYVVQPGDQLILVAQYYGISLQDLAAYNGISPVSNLFVGQTLAIPTAPVAQTYTYVVQPGDTLSIIAQSFGVSTQSVAAYNGIFNANSIYVGQLITIPR